MKTRLKKKNTLRIIWIVLFLGSALLFILCLEELHTNGLHSLLDGGYTSGHRSRLSLGNTVLSKLIASIVFMLLALLNLFIWNKSKIKK